ncbi:hypothetical protein IC608_02650 [Devosia sp. PTR5]|uniref:Uncharacterized protein n=1 Tax=Devosia oryzisoli TaxID=2774138 RepID=A0A927FQH0_9HYPH|nr:hypothetical protein [Devosia oryzisoli]MBD8064375.1 hypothetical protein [Devosia oryzisoli]
MTTPHARAQDKTGASVGFNLAGIAALVLLLAVGAAYLVDHAGRGANGPLPSLDDGDRVVQTLGGRELTVPRNWIVANGNQRSGFVSEINLTTRLDLGLAEGPVSVDVTLLPRGRVRSSATLLDTVYLHQFAGPTLSGAAGLVGKPLQDADGYSGETVWYDPLAPGPFVAKCQTPIENGAQDRCLRTVHLPSGLAAVFSFSATALAGWRSFDTEMALWLDQIGAL